MKKKVLIIAYAFPPVGGAGVQRTVKFAKYLPDSDWEPIVLTVKNPSVPLSDFSFLNDNSLDNLKIYKAKSIELGYSLKMKAWNYVQQDGRNKKDNALSRSLQFIKRLALSLLIPDPQVGWVPFAVIKGLWIIFIQRIDVIFVTGPPFSSFFIGRILSFLTSIPWTADFRDEWVTFYSENYNFHKSNRNRDKLRRLERNVFASASTIITATNSISINYRKLYPEYADKIETITNGYDHDDFTFSLLGNGTDKVSSIKNSVFTIVYTGTVFKVTSASNFIKAIDLIIQDKPLYKDCLSVEFVGRIVDDEMCHFERFGYKEVIKTFGYMTHSECLRKQIEADVLLLLLNDLPGAERILTGKLFEYLACKKRILAVVPDGEVSNLLRSLNVGDIVHPNDIKGIKELIESYVKSWLSGSVPYENLNEDKFERFSRKELTKVLANSLNSAIKYK